MTFLTQAADELLWPPVAGHVANEVSRASLAGSCVNCSPCGLDT